MSRPLRLASRIILLGFFAATANCGYMGIELKSEQDSLTIRGVETADTDHHDTGGRSWKNDDITYLATGGADDADGSGGWKSRANTEGDRSSGGALGGATSDTGSSKSGGAGSGGAGSGGAGSGGMVDEGVGGSQADDCLGHDDINFSLIGWAGEAGGTRGGKGGSSIRVTTGAEIVQALSNKRVNTPLTILVSGVITPANSGVEKIDIKNVRDVSIIGLGDGAEFDGIGFKLWKTGNIVMRNLRIHHVDTGEKDSISIEGPADHIWIDHCELYSNFQEVEKGRYDGLIDAKGDSQYLTYSWNYMHDSWESALVGSSETDDFDRKLTMHHNWISNCNAAAPVFRGGNGHIFNNHYEDIETAGINTRMGACLLIENNSFVNVVNPWVSAFSEVLGGAQLVRNKWDSSSEFTYSSQSLNVLNCEASVPYDYSDSLTEINSVQEMVKAQSGVGKLADPNDF